MKTNTVEQIILSLIIIIVTMVISIFIKMQLLKFGFDYLDSFILFVCCILICLVTYLSLNLIILNLFRFLHNKDQDLGNVEKHESQERSNTLDITYIRNIQNELIQQEKDQKLEIAIEYTINILSPYIDNAGLEKIITLIPLYDKNEKIKSTIKISVSKLSSIDLLHWGWNIGHHFHKRRSETAQFLKAVFSEALKDSTITTIERKLSNTDTSSIISLQKDLYSYNQSLN